MKMAMAVLTKRALPPRNLAIAMLWAQDTKDIVQLAQEDIREEAVQLAQEDIKEESLQLAQENIREEAPQLAQEDSREEAERQEDQAPPPAANP